MKLKVKKMIKKLNNCMFDVAAAPMYIMLFGVPALIGLFLGFLLWFAVKAIMKIYQDKKREEEKH